MLPKRGLRLIGLNALLIAIMVQGLTPCTSNLVSPWALRWLDPWASANHSDLGHGGIPGHDRAAPLDRTDRNEAQDDVVTPGDFRSPTILSRWSSLPSIRPAWIHARHNSLLVTRLQGPPALVTDLISSICRMTC
jgi:hypothetical protein